MHPNMGRLAEIAEKIGQVLHQAGLQVDILPVKTRQRYKVIRCNYIGQRRLYVSMAAGCGIISKEKSESVGRTTYLAIL